MPLDDKLHWAQRVLAEPDADDVRFVSCMIAKSKSACLLSSF